MLHKVSLVSYSKLHIGNRKTHIRYIDLHLQLIQKLYDIIKLAINIHEVNISTFSHVFSEFHLREKAHRQTMTNLFIN